MVFLTFSQTTIFELFQTERNYRQKKKKMNLTKMEKSSQTKGGGRKYCEKRRNFSLRAISSCPKAFSTLVLKPLRTKPFPC